MIDTAGDGEYGSLMEQIDWDHLLNGVPIPDDPTGSAGVFLSIEQFLMRDDDDDDHQPPVQCDLAADSFFSDVLLDSPVDSFSSDKVNDDVPQTQKEEGNKVNGDVFPYVFLDSPVDSSSDDDKVNDAPQPQKEDNMVNVDVFPDVFLDSPVDCSSDKVNDDVPQPGKEGGDKENDDLVLEQDDDNNPLAKKRKRQMRNRDAALRSRERKKVYVRDLEMKSKYFEAECKRLGMWLQCCLAENHALRLSLHNSKAVDASVTRQESAVLLLESLLLGSLLWFLGIICLFTLPRQLPSALKAVPLDNVGSGSQGSLGPREGRSKTFRNCVVQSFMMGKRCKGSRSRMKLIFGSMEVKV